MEINSQIPLEAGPAGAAKINSQIPMEVNAQTPLSVKPFTPIDVAGAQVDAYKMADSIDQFKENQAERLDAQALREEKQRDKAILTAGQQSGLDLYTSGGLELAMKDLKGKVSLSTFEGLAKRADAKKQDEIKLNESVTKLSDYELDLVTKQHETTTKMISRAVAVYDDTLNETKDPEKAKQAFESAKEALLKSAQQMTSPTTGKPLVSPEKLAQFAKMTPDQLKNVIKETEWHSKLMKDEAINRLRNAQAGLTGDKAENEKKFGGIKGTSKVAEIRRMVAQGEMTEEEGSKLIKENLTAAGKAEKGWKLTSANGKPYRANANEGKIQRQTDEGDWEDIPPSEMPPELIESLGGKKAQSAITQRYNQRTMTAAGEVLRNVDMLGMMPVGQTKGIFNYHSDGGLSSALKNKLTSEDAIDYNTSMSGMVLELTTVLRNGMQLNETEMASIEKGATANPGDTVANTRYKLANVIAKVKVALENFEPSTEQQKTQRDKYLKSVQKYPTPEEVYAENQSGKLKFKTAGEDLQEIKDKADEAKPEETPAEKGKVYKQVGKYKTPDQVKADYKAGTLTKDEAKSLLTKMGFSGG